MESNRTCLIPLAPNLFAGVPVQYIADNVLTLHSIQALCSCTTKPPGRVAALIIYFCRYFVLEYLPINVVSAVVDEIPLTFGSSLRFIIRGLPTMAIPFLIRFLTIQPVFRCRRVRNKSLNNLSL